MSSIVEPELNKLKGYIRHPVNRYLYPYTMTVNPNTGVTVVDNPEDIFTDTTPSRATLQPCYTSIEAIAHDVNVSIGDEDNPHLGNRSRLQKVAELASEFIDDMCQRHFYNVQEERLIRPSGAYLEQATTERLVQINDFVNMPLVMPLIGAANDVINTVLPESITSRLESVYNNTVINSSGNPTLDGYAAVFNQGALLNSIPDVSSSIQAYAVRLVSGFQAIIQSRNLSGGNFQDWVDLELDLDIIPQVPIASSLAKEPYNALYKITGTPIVVHSAGATLRMYATWGWDFVPNPIQEASKLLAVRYLSRFKVDVAEMFLDQVAEKEKMAHIWKQDPDVQVLIQPYAKGGVFI